MRYLSNYLRLVFPPLSNQGADWLWKDKEVRELVKESKLYMIGHREEVTFENFNVHQSASRFISFQLKMGDIVSPTIYYNAYEELTQFASEDDEVILEMGPHLIRFTLNTADNVIQWFTPDKFLFLLSRKLIRVELESEFELRKFSTFELYYVGISKKGDSFSRLYDQGHKGRLKILTNENTKVPTARLTDELVIFLFDIESDNINILELDDFEKDLNYRTDKVSIISDAEKAFVKLLDTKYNDVKYPSFPKSNDGLYEEGLTRYGYSIREDISFFTDSIQFNGNSNLFSRDADMIAVENDKVDIIKFT